MKTNTYLEILKLRKYLNVINQISYSFAQVNKAFSPLENQSQENLEQIKQFYLELIKEALTITNSYKEEYENKNNQNQNLAGRDF
jgi:ribosome-binding ATPase YchF (GTP1/OBG family)